MATTSIYWTKPCYMLVLRWMVFPFHGRNDLLVAQVHEHAHSVIFNVSALIDGLTKIKSIQPQNIFCLLRKIKSNSISCKKGEKKNKRNQ